MVKHLVEKTFRDKKTSQLVLAGSFFESDDKKRLDEMYKQGFLKEEEPVKKATTRKKSGE